MCLYFRDQNITDLFLGRENKPEMKCSGSSLILMTVRNTYKIINIMKDCLPSKSHISKFSSQTHIEYKLASSHV